MAGRRTALGGLPLAFAAATRRRAGTSVTQIPPGNTSRGKLLSLLKRKGWQVEDLERNPAVLGVPLGQNGKGAGVEVDIGLKNMVTTSLSELVDASPKLKQALLERALEQPGTERVEYTDLLRKNATVSVIVHAQEDILGRPVASVLHPKALEANVPADKLKMLQDPFFRANPPSAELVDLVVEAVPGADRHVAAKDEHRRELRAAAAAARQMSGARF